MDQNIEKKVRNAYDDISLQEVTDYLETVDMPDVSADSKARIKALVDQKMGQSSMAITKGHGKANRYQGRILSKGVIRFVAVAATLILVISGVFMLNTDSVKAALAKLFGFVPGVGVVEVPVDESGEVLQESRWYVLEQAKYDQKNDMVEIEIQNANIVKDVLTVNYVVDLLDISIPELEQLSAELSEESFKDYVDLYRNKGYETYFEIKESADMLTPLSSVELGGKGLNLIDREVLSGESLEGAKLICISECYKVADLNTDTMPKGSLTVGVLKVDFAMKDLQTYIQAEGAEQNGAVCISNGIELLCVPMWEDETLYLDFYTLESGEFDRLLGFGMGGWPIVTVNNQEVEGYTDESYVFASENTGCFGRRVYYDLSVVEGEIKTVEVSLDGVMAVRDGDSAVLDVTNLDTQNKEKIDFSQVASMTRTEMVFNGLNKYQDEDEFLYSEYGNVTVKYCFEDKKADAVFAGFDRIYINDVKQDIWAMGDGELYLKLPCAYEELEKIEGKGAQYFVHSSFYFTIEK